MKYTELNKEQLQAVMSDHPRILCLAGAGCGKTKTMVTRAARLIEEGVEPSNILMLTFTNAAAREQKERLINLVGEAGEKVWASTFHSWAVREIKRYAPLIGYNSNFSIYDQEDTESIVTAIIEELQGKVKPKEVIDAMTKNHVYGVPIPAGTIKVIVTEYNFRCKRQNAIDLDSLISTLQKLLQKDITNKLMHDQYKYVFVDEMQDTDQRQMRLLELLDPENLFVVGDDFQSIYGFRGADVRIIMGLAEDPEWQTIKLEENYRSTRQIVNTANNLIKHNNQTEKILKARRNGPDAALIEENTPFEELEWIANKCLRIGHVDGTYMDTAILARTNKQVEAIADALREFGVPYTIRRRVSDALQSTAARKLFAWMQATINPLDNEAVASILNWPERTITRLEMLETEMFQLEQDCSLIAALEAKGKCAQITETIRRIHEDAMNLRASGLFEYIVDETGLEQAYQDKGLGNRTTRLREIQELIEEWQRDRRDAGQTITGEDWLEYYKMRLIDGADPEEAKYDAVNLMTVHGSKGLEFDNVIIAGLNNKSFPLGRADLKEERRLCYVALTRAKSRLYLTRSTMRYVWGDRMEEAEPSIFLEEI